MVNKQSCASMPFNVKIFIVDGRPDGLRLVTKTGWNGIGVVCPRNIYVDARERDEFKRCGVYILLGENENSSTPIIYIGETDEVLQRLDRHSLEKNKDFWQQTIVFTSEGNTLNKLNKADVRYLEAELVKLARKNKRYDIKNMTNPNHPSLSESAKAEIEWYLEGMLLLLPILGVTAFEKTEAITKDSGGAGDAIEYHLKGDGFKAKGYEITNNGFVVSKGSTTVSEFRNHAIKRGRLYAIRQELIRKKVLKKITNQDGYEFTTDHPFSSPSTAAAICNGRITNGRKEWKDIRGVSFGEHHGDKKKSSDENVKERS